jgi:hypothetical protein
MISVHVRKLKIISFYKMNGGRRPGAGRKRGGRNAAQLKIIDIAGQVLQEIDAKEKWKALRNCNDPRVIVDVMKYLSDRAFGRPVQMIAGDPNKPVSKLTELDDRQNGCSRASP